MKKILCVCFVLATFVLGAFSQSLNADGIVSDMVMPDGNTATIALYKKWGPANTDIQAVQPKDKKAMIGTTVTKAKTESEIGYFRKTYKENETEDIAALCEAMKSCGATYGVAWLDFGSRVTRCVFTYKSGKLTYDRMDFFDESNGDYADFVAKENAKKERAEKVVGDLTKALLSPVSNAVSAGSNKNETPEQTLYELRHHTYTTFIAGKSGQVGENISFRHIYHDDGSLVIEYVVDLDGNLRTDISGNYSIVQYYSVSKEIRELALKSLE